ncbi:MAG TPA: CsgG/HfaB family protein [Steroidobacteraceae bacterium]|nr:CsgG/HfaB family protein [Steroidobacteraceae bacterium]
MSSSLSVRLARGGCLCAAALLAAGACLAATAQDERAKKEAEIPTCPKKYGAISVIEPQHNWWTEYQLASPEALLKIYVNKSGCFTLVDRGKGLAAAKTERDLASSGELRGRSNVGKGQIKAADYVLVPDLVSQNRNAGGKSIGGLLGGLVPGAAGAALGGLNIKKKTADVTLTVTDVRSTEQVALTEGHSTKTDLGWGAGGSLFTGGAFGAGGATGYDNTEIGQVIALAYLQAYTDLVKKFAELPDNASAANEQQAVTMAKPGRMYAAASPSSKVVRTLDPGMMLYPTGQKQEVMWEVEDELGNKGWVSSLLFQLAK